MNLSIGFKKFGGVYGLFVSNIFFKPLSVIAISNPSILKGEKFNAASSASQKTSSPKGVLISLKI
jgi:hypothetical protein